MTDLPTAHAPALMLAHVHDEPHVLVVSPLSGFFAGGLSLPVTDDPISLAFELGMGSHVLSEDPVVLLCEGGTPMRIDVAAQDLRLQWLSLPEALHRLTSQAHRQLLARALTLLLPAETMPATLAA